MILDEETWGGMGTNQRPIPKDGSHRNEQRGVSRKTRR
jgi:hypothetical protein